MVMDVSSYSPKLPHSKPNELRFVVQPPRKLFESCSRLLTSYYVITKKLLDVYEPKVFSDCSLRRRQNPVGTCKRSVSIAGCKDHSSDT